MNESDASRLSGAQSTSEMPDRTDALAAPFNPMADAAANDMTDNAPPDAAASPSLEKLFRERLRDVKSATERRTLITLARELGRLPTDLARAALETSAAIAAISLRASIEFLRQAPRAARVLESANMLRAWGEMGRRVAMSDAEKGIAFFAAGVEDFALLPPESRALVLQICARQLTLSSAVALDTFKRAPLIAREVANAEALRRIFEVAAEISRRSAKHSADFLNAAPQVAAALRSFNEHEQTPYTDKPAREDGDAAVAAAMSIEQAALKLVGAFAMRAGGTAAEAWAALPAALDKLATTDAYKLLQRTEGFLERGGGAALQVLIAGGEVLRRLPKVFDEWVDLLWVVAEQGNAGLIAFVRASPSFFQALASERETARALEVAGVVVTIAREVAQVDAEAALACFRSSLPALHSASLEQFAAWARYGFTLSNVSAQARRSYYALETRRSHEQLRPSSIDEETHTGLALDAVRHTLRLYIEALTGRAVDIAPLAAISEEARISDGRTIHLPAFVNEFGDEAKDFRLYKVLAAHAAGQIEFGTHEPANSDLQVAYNHLRELYAPENLDARDAFALSGYIQDVRDSEPALAPEEEARRARQAERALPHDADYRAVLALFPHAALAQKVFGTLENARIDRRLRHAYRGLARDLNLTRDHLRQRRPRIIDLPVTLVPFELLFQIALCGGALDDARRFYSQIVSELEIIVADYLTSPTATVADTLMATHRVYALFQSITPEHSEQSGHDAQSSDEPEASGATSQQNAESDTTPDTTPSPDQTPSHDARELFNAWNTSAHSTDDGLESLHGAERWTHTETPEQDLEPGDTAYAYDEWDRDLTDTRVNWCRVVEKRARRADTAFVEQTRTRHRGVISSIRHQFQLLKPESLTRINNELDGDDYDLNAVIDYVVDRRADGRQSERLYTKRLRRERHVAVSFLLDQSSSTARTIGRHPLQPYTHPGRRIIEIEKEGLVLMSEALESLGDSYSINGFTSEGRRNVRFYVVKDFNETYSEEVHRRIGGITYQNNTRLGAAVRHAAARLSRQDARTKLLIVLSDGRPYDHDYGDARYAREDTREALRSAKRQGITPFCITIDRESEIELRDLYGDVGYTIIDDVLSLPERLPGIYRRLTT